MKCVTYRENVYDTTQHEVKLNTVMQSLFQPGFLKSVVRKFSRFYFLNDEEDIQTVFNFWGYSKKVVSKIIENIMALSPGECYVHKSNNYEYEVFSCVK